MTEFIVFNIGVLLAKVQTNGEPAVIVIIQLVQAVATIRFPVAVIQIVIRKKHHQYHIHQIRKKAQIQVIRIINCHPDLVLVCKILKILHLHAYGQSHIYIVQAHQIPQT